MSRTPCIRLRASTRTSGAGPALVGLLLLLLAAVPGRAETTLTVFAQAYTPEITTGDNPRPLHEFTRLAEEFERLHPDVKVRFLKSPVGDFRTWMRTQLQGGMAPDVMWAHSTWTNEDARYGWFVNLDPYLEQPNPHCAPGVRGRARWRDQFYSEATNSKRAPDGHLYSLPIDQVETCIFYNQDLFDQVGAKPPKTWGEWMEIHRKLQAAGIIPFLMTGAQEMRLTWARRILNDQLWEDLVPKMDVRTTEGWGFPGVDQQEFIRAQRTGIFSVRNPRYRELLRLLKDWSRYWQRGFLAAQDDRLFRLGKVAMWWDGSWYTPVIQQDPLRKFRFGMFLVPPLGPGDSRYMGRGIARGVGGATSIQYAITNSAVAAKKVELAVDFLRFITAPQNIQPLVSEAGLFVPNVVGLQGAPTLSLFNEVLRTGATRFNGEDAGPRSADQAFRTLQGFLGGQYTEDETLARLERYLTVGVEQTLRDNTGTWQFGPQMEVLPNATPAPATGTSGPSLFSPAAILGVLLGLVLVGASLALLRRDVRRARISYLFVLPTISLLLLFSYYPILSALGHAFTEWKGSGAAIWVGLANFQELMHDDVFLDGIGNTLKLLAAHLVISLTAPLAVAEMIFALRGERSQYVYRVLFVIPMVVPGVVILLIWGFLYDDNVGMLNQVLQAVGLGHWQQSWLGDPKMALYSLMFLGFPWVGGFALLIYYAGLQNVSTDVFDSARLDGASGLRRFRSIDLPLLMGQIKLLVVLGFIGGLQGFQTQLLLTNGGPAYATMVPGLHLYQNAISFDRMGYACAVGVLLFLAILGITYLNLKYLRSSTEHQA